MSETFEVFDAAVAPLHRGVNMVEASAGTGKTFAIAMLVLRFVTEFAVPVEQLLVVSYTRAATEELRARIRKRLLEAKELLCCEKQETGDEVLFRYLQHLPDKRLALERLELALLDLDRAPVFTIHSFCQRMLQEQALESGQLFDMELTADVRRVREELVADFWRRHLYGLSPFHCSLFLHHYNSLEALYASVAGVGPEDLIEPADRVAPAKALEQVDEALRALISWWQRREPVLRPFFQEALEQKMFKKDFTQNFDSWWQQCNSFFTGESSHLPSGLENLDVEGLLAQLNGSRLRGEVRKKEFLQDWPLAGRDMARFAEACRQAVLSLRISLALELQSGLRERLNKQGRLSFDDLVVLLANALQEEQGQELRAILGGRFQVALIDEFQDTDAAQYRIFSTLFGRGKHFLYLIGDPKQAIYKFRGADIFAYFQARHSADHGLGLARNYRSSPLLVRAVNDLFLSRDDSFVFAELPYRAVSAAQPPERLRLLQGGEVQAAMVYCSLESPDENGVKAWTSGKCQERIQDFVVAEIRRLLQDGSLAGDDSSAKKVSAGDIAVLVRSNKQAEAFQEILALAGVPAVMSSRKTVFESRECADLRQVSLAVSSPADIGLLRTALSCKWFGLKGRELYRQVQDDAIIESWMERFHDYHRLWQEKGFLAMMNMLFVRESVFQSLAGTPLAERQISNLVHLVELIQEKASSENLSIAHTMQYLSSMMVNTEAHEHAELRLESDEQAVKVVTMHAVKGLEYPIVFCPYLWYRSGRLQREEGCLSYHNKEGQLVTDLGSSDFAERRRAALEEELAEEVRLLYVALTRAASCCYAFWADVRGTAYTTPSKESALSWVLSLEGCDTIGEQTGRISALCDGEKTRLRLVAACAAGGERLEAVEAEAEALQSRTFRRSSLPGEWLMTSYSALAGHGYFSAGGDGIPAVLAGERVEGERIIDLPFGAGFGNVVHGLLEELPFSLLAERGDYGEEVAAQCRRYGVQADTDLIMGLLQAVTRSPLVPGKGQGPFCLADIGEGDVLKEMPFYFHLREESTARINELLAFSEVVRPVQERQLKGYLTGFVDLVCRVGGKYYIMDYKSNYLGDYFSDYRGVQLVTAMHDHNYGLQYWIYTLVLHRFLQNTLAGYAYERDFGGVFYLFARGMDPKLPGNGFFFDRPSVSVLDELQRSLGAR